LGELAQDDPSGQPVALQMRGSVVVAHRGDAANLQHFERMLRHKLPDHQGAVEALGAPELAALAPELVPTFDRGLYLAEEGCLDNWGLCDSLASAMPALGGEGLSGVEVERVEPGVVIAADGHRFEAEIAADTRGFGAKPES